MIDTIVSVIDTISAFEEFSLVKPSILQNIEELRSKQNICNSILSSNQKKAKTDAEKLIVSEAYTYAVSNIPELFYYNDRQRDEKDIRKNKISDRVKSFLSRYNDYLISQISYLNLSIEYDWTSFLDNPPMKLDTIKIENPNYRGFHYNNYMNLNRIELSRLLGDYEFLISSNGEYIKKTYPIELSYTQYLEIPNCKVLDHSFDGLKLYEIYNSQGELISIPILQRQSTSEIFPNSISKEIRRLIYLRDYQNNKYSIKSANTRTQNFLSLWIKRPQGLSKSGGELAEMEREGYFRGLGGLLGTNATTANEQRCRELNSRMELYNDDEGKRFLKQLESDHADEFGYIYAIERLSEKRFVIVFLNSKTLKPSICGVVTFFTGDKPYTCDFSVKLCETPSNVPPVIKQE